MSINISDIKKIAWLARLSVGKEDITDYLHDVSDMIDMVGEIKSVNTDNLEPLAYPLTTTTDLWRQDEITETDQHEHFQQGAPATQHGYYLVPKVIT